MVHKSRKVKSFYLVMTSVLVIITLISGYVTTQAASVDKITLTLEECVDKAVNNGNATINTINSSIRSLNRNRDALVDGEELFNKKFDEGVKAYIDFYIMFGRTCDPSNMPTPTPVDSNNPQVDPTVPPVDIIEQFETLKTEYLKYGIAPPPANLTDAELDNHFRLKGYYKYIHVIKAFDFRIDEIDANLDVLKNNREVAEESIRKETRRLYDSILNMQDTYNLQRELYDIQSRQFEVLLVKLNAGQVSQLDKFTTERDLKKQKINLDKTKREIENLKMNLKQQTGIELTKEIELKPYEFERLTPKPRTYESYLDDALDNRSELVNARINLEVKLKQYNTMKDYISDDDSIEWLEAYQAMNEKSIALDQAIDSATQDIKTGYNDLINKQSNMEIAAQKEVNSSLKYSEAEVLYNQGLASLPSLWDIETTCYQTKTSRQKAKYDYYTALYNMELSCGTGPQYAMMTGVR